MLLACNNDCNEAVNRLLDGSAVGGIQRAGNGVAAAAKQAWLQLRCHDKYRDQYNQVKSCLLGKDITEHPAIRAAMAAMAAGQLTLQRGWQSGWSDAGLANDAQRSAGALVPAHGAPAPAVPLQLPPLSLLTWNVWYAVSVSLAGIA